MVSVADVERPPVRVVLQNKCSAMSTPSNENHTTCEAFLFAKEPFAIITHLRA